MDAQARVVHVAAPHHEAVVALAEAVQIAVIQKAIAALLHREVVSVMQPHMATDTAHQHQAATVAEAHTAVAEVHLAAAHHHRAALVDHAHTKAPHQQVRAAHTAAEHAVVEAHLAVVAAARHSVVTVVVHAAEAEVEDVVSLRLISTSNVLSKRAHASRQHTFLRWSPSQHMS